jgi:hypothetical protein
MNQFECDSNKSKYAIEPNGDNFVLYYGRSNNRHGYNLATISDIAFNCDLKHIEKLINLGNDVYQKNPTGGHVAE